MNKKEVLTKHITELDLTQSPCYSTEVSEEKKLCKKFDEWYKAGGETRKPDEEDIEDFLWYLENRL